MAELPTIKKTVDRGYVRKHCTIQLKVKVSRLWSWQCWTAGRLVKFAAWLMGGRGTVEYCPNG